MSELSIHPLINLIPFESQLPGSASSAINTSLDFLSVVFDKFFYLLLELLLSGVFDGHQPLQLILGMLFVVVGKLHCKVLLTIRKFLNGIPFDLHLFLLWLQLLLMSPVAKSRGIDGLDNGWSEH